MGNFPKNKTIMFKINKINILLWDYNEYFKML